ncbi:YbhB/YbcL family Raf kinase inhibitor-like protein [Mycoplasma miroungirhinis]|uniref:YbhB/YbcL family Raf kinase inhibitor-like protein n=1 Tax=Mycoplasma miroungirhinis TaxID=754516 RepID=A0A6M4JCD4_9MOLU|nr:YbhB/YbcL family Raf kinase inhibitor-like protein [Mycoplasma miroungirhinis]QJR44005.1 YbhB/YbcL family Raf kinase inhibitor-like protein [Mycoplasma miroungirhinis]
MKVYSKSINIYNVLNPNHSLISTFSPHLGWDEVKNAKSYAILMIDHEAAGVVGLSFVHWGIFNIKDNFIAENSSILKDKNYFQIENSLSIKPQNPILDHNYLKINANMYTGPFPPDQDHVYICRVFALDFEDVSDYWDTTKPMYIGDFWEIINDHTIDQGVLTFSSPQAYIEDNINYQKEASTHGLFYVYNEHDEISTLKVNIKDMLVDENIYYLSKPYYFDDETIQKTNFKISTPQIKIKNPKNIKEYAIFIYDSNSFDEWGLVTNEYCCLGIKAQNSDWTLLNKDDLIKADKNKIFIKNSYYNHSQIPEKIKKLFQLKNHSWSLFKSKKMASSEKFHWMEIYALDQKIIDKDKINDIADAYRHIKNKVIAEKIIRFKLK